MNEQVPSDRCPNWCSGQEVWAARPTVGEMREASPSARTKIALPKCDCDPCPSDGEDDFPESCSHGTHCAACPSRQTGQWIDCCVSNRAQAAESDESADAKAEVADDRNELLSMRQYWLAQARKHRRESKVAQASLLNAVAQARKHRRESKVAQASLLNAERRARWAYDQIRYWPRPGRSYWLSHKKATTKSTKRPGRGG